MMQAIETVYKGYRFRSRTEARWAVFFDTLGVRWEYENEGYDLSQGAWDALERAQKESENDFFGFWSRRKNEISVLLTNADTWYLPDFFLPDFGKYIEIKPYNGREWWGDETTVKACLLGAIVVHGLPGTIQDETYGLSCDTIEDTSHYFGHCPVCGSFGEGYCAWAERICSCWKNGTYHHKQDMSKTDSMLRAIAAARGARFEHGENP